MDYSLIERSPGRARAVARQSAAPLTDHRKRRKNTMRWTTRNRSPLFIG
ncbi:MAG: hypothetical protein IPK76_19550 [Lewinellaceae bacterium]|nr:hypothetical protein [Lewinellaceae bacterium]